MTANTTTAAMTEADFAALASALGVQPIPLDVAAEARRRASGVPFYRGGVLVHHCVDIDADGYCNDCGWSQPEG